MKTTHIEYSIWNDNLKEAALIVARHTTGVLGAWYDELGDLVCLVRVDMADFVDHEIGRQFAVLFGDEANQETDVS